MRSISPVSSCLRLNAEEMLSAFLLSPFFFVLFLTHRHRLDEEQFLPRTILLLSLIARRNNNKIDEIKRPTNSDDNLYFTNGVTRTEVTRSRERARP